MRVHFRLPTFVHIEAVGPSVLFVLELMELLHANVVRFCSTFEIFFVFIIVGRLQKEDRSSLFATCIASKAQALMTQVCCCYINCNFNGLISPVYGLCSLV